MLCKTVIVFLLIAVYQGLAFQTSVLNPVQLQRQAAKGFLSGNGIMTTFGSPPRESRRTELNLVESDSMDIVSSWMLDFPSVGVAQQLESSGLGIGNLVLGLGFLAAIGAYVFANVVYTPEILEGARDLRIAERETEIRKILQAIETHEGEMVELKVPLETALGKPLEEYVQSVLEDGSDNNNTDFAPTAADMELATILKRTIVS